MGGSMGAVVGEKSPGDLFQENVASILKLRKYKGTLDS